jgi:hypothetical protein
MTRPKSVLRTGLAAAFIVTAAFIPVHRVRASTFDDYTAPRDANVDARGAKSIEVRAGAGSLRIEGKPGISQVQVRGIARASQRNRLTDIKLIAERRGDVVYIKADMPEESGSGFWNLGRDDWNMQLDLVIEVPQNIALDVEDGSGDAKFMNVGPMKLTDGSGELSIIGVKGDLEVEDGSGNMTIENVEGRVRVSDGSGEIRAKNIVGDFIVEEDGSGSIDVAGVGGSMRVEEDGSGGIDVDQIAGDFTVDHKGSGSISSSGVRGKIDIPDRHRRRGSY